MTLAEPLRFRVFEFMRRMSSGVTGPLLCAAALPDGSTRRVVLKLRDPGTPYGNGHLGATSLAAEIATSTIARTLGLGVPDYGIAEVDARFARAVSDRTTSELLKRNVGPNFATVLMTDGVVTWNPSTRSAPDVLRQAMDDVLALDATIFNGDRKRKDSPNLLWDGGERVFMIDHSLAAIAYRWTLEQVAESPLFPEDQVRAHLSFDVLLGTGSRFTSVHAAWSKTLSSIEWSALRTVIPPEWEAHPGEVDRMLTFLAGRSERFAAIAADLRRLLG